MGCLNPKKETHVAESTVEHDGDFKNEFKSSYNYLKPDQIFKLDKNLKEISGLDYIDQTDQLIANNDEKGTYFILDKSNGHILESKSVLKNGDFEAIEIIDSTVYLLRNTGTLHSVDMSTGKKSKWNNILSSKNDVEGMCYDVKSGSLLLSCKGQALGHDDRQKKIKCVYKYNLAQHVLDTVPFLKISQEHLRKQLKKDFSNTGETKPKSKLSRMTDFSPSGIAIHPITSNYYIISAKGSSVIQLDKEGSLIEIGFFDEGVLTQPEGITFDREGNLYIASEGKSKSGKIARYTYID